MLIPPKYLLTPKLVSLLQSSDFSARIEGNNLTLGVYYSTTSSPSNVTLSSDEVTGGLEKAKSSLTF